MVGFLITLVLLCTSITGFAINPWGGDVLVVCKWQNTLYGYKVSEDGVSEGDVFFTEGREWEGRIRGVSIHKSGEIEFVYQMPADNEAHLCSLVSSRPVTIARLPRVDGDILYACSSHDRRYAFCVSCDQERQLSPICTTFSISEEGAKPSRTVTLNSGRSGYGLQNVLWDSSQPVLYFTSPAGDLLSLDPVTGEQRLILSDAYSPKAVPGKRSLLLCDKERSVFEYDLVSRCKIDRNVAAGIGGRYVWNVFPLSDGDTILIEADVGWSIYDDAGSLWFGFLSGRQDKYIKRIRAFGPDAACGRVKGE